VKAAKNGAGAKRPALARRAAMVASLRREIARIAESVTFGVKLGGGVEARFVSLAEFREYQGCPRAVVLPPPSWFTEWFMEQDLWWFTERA